jgi:hypothetical protein
METGLFVDKGLKFMVPSMKRGDFMDKWPVLEDLSMKRGDFMDDGRIPCQVRLQLT